MYVYIGADFEGNLYITDERDCLPSDLVSFQETWVKLRENPNATLHVDIEDYSEIISLHTK